MKEKLIKALQEERERFLNRQQDTLQHDVTIMYLETDKLPVDIKSVDEVNPDNYELLDAAINDFECLCSDYGANK